jgi:hypothetical protein
MADNSTAMKLVAMGTSATAIAAIAIALSQKEAKAGTQPGQISQEMLALLQAISGATGQTVVELIAILEALQSGNGPIQGTIQGYPPNQDVFRVVALNCQVALQPYQAPEILVPEGFHVALKAHPGNAVASEIRVASGSADCTNVNSSWPLIFNEPLLLGIKNTKNIWVSSNVAGSRVLIGCEQRS